jgi:hypothetical protein
VKWFGAAAINDINDECLLHELVGSDKVENLEW